MKDHLFMNHSNIAHPEPFQHLNHRQYFMKRIQFWKYRLKRTMGRPVLILWRTPTKENDRV